MSNVKKRLINALKSGQVDRPPFISPGGMMNMVTTDILQSLDLTWSQVYSEPEQMAGLALKVSDLIGVENLGLPFCMTVEAEALGAEVEMDSIYSEPRVVKYPLSRLKNWHLLRDFDLTKGRAAVLLQAVQELHRLNHEKPLIVTLTGPISLATSLLEPMILYRSMKSDTAEVHAFLKFLSKNLINFAESLAAAGADVLVIADPSASGEILGPKFFAEFALPYLNQITEESGDYYQGTMLHICGRLNSILAQIDQLSSPAFSIDSATSITTIRSAVPGKAIVGNVSTHLLQNADPEKIKRAAFVCLSHGVAVLAPACGISMSTPIPNLQAMAAAAREWPDIRNTDRG